MRRAAFRNSDIGLPSSSSKEYLAWAHMIARCTNPREQRYQRYGGRGIRVCDRWKEFAHFFADMGNKPMGMSLGRINNDGDYEPCNCRWETPEQQWRNKSNSIVFEIDGEKKTMTEWARIYGLSPVLVRARIVKLGWDIHRALNTPRAARAPDVIANMSVQKRLWWEAIKRAQCEAQKELCK